MMKPKPPCVTLPAWLEANLGPRCLAPLTGTDAKALSAAVQIVELYSYCATAEVAKAFGLVVSEMQPSTREFAFHAVAHDMDWDHRYQLWTEAGLMPMARSRFCKFEPKPIPQPQAAPAVA